MQRKTIARMSAKSPREGECSLAAKIFLYSSEELLIEILSWLPAKAIFKLLMQSEELFKLRHNPILRALHADRVTEGIGIIIDSGPSLLHIIPVDDAFGLPVDALQFMREDVDKVLDSQNGLIVYHSKSKELRVLNPVTKLMCMISYPPGNQLQDTNKKLALFLHTINAKVYEIICLFSEYQYEEESFKLALDFWKYTSTHEWEHIGEFYPCCIKASTRDAVLVNGFIYWLGLGFSEEHQLFSFNIDTKRLETVDLPRDVPTEMSAFTQLAIAAWQDETLSLIVNRKGEKQMDIWVRQCSGPSEFEWLIVHNAMLGDDFKEARYRGMIFDKSLVFSQKNTMHFYSFKTKSLKEVGKFNNTELSVVKTYIATFRTCGMEEQSMVRAEKKCS